VHGRRTEPPGGRDEVGDEQAGGDRHRREQHAEQGADARDDLRLEQRRDAAEADRAGHEHQDARHHQHQRRPVAPPREEVADDADGHRAHERAQLEAQQPRADAAGRHGDEADHHDAQRVAPLGLQDDGEGEARDADRDRQRPAREGDRRELGHLAEYQRDDAFTERHPEADAEEGRGGGREARRARREVLRGQLAHGHREREPRDQHDEPGERCHVHRVRQHEPRRDPGHEARHERHDRLEHAQEPRPACGVECEQAGEQPDEGRHEQFRPPAAQEHRDRPRRRDERAHRGERAVDRRLRLDLAQAHDALGRRELALHHGDGEAVELAHLREVHRAGIDPEQVRALRAQRAERRHDRGGRREDLREGQAQPLGQPHHHLLHARRREAVPVEGTPGAQHELDGFGREVGHGQQR
jgi:hypothetical protein